MSSAYNSEFSRSQSLASGTGSGVISTYHLSLKGLKRLTFPVPVFVELQVKTAFEGSNDTLDVDVVSTTDDDTTSWASLNVVQQAAKVIPAESGVGTRVYFLLPDAEITSGDDHIALRYYARGEGALTAGAISARLTLEPGRDVIMPRETDHIG